MQKRVRTQTSEQAKRRADAAAGSLPAVGDEVRAVVDGQYVRGQVASVGVTPGIVAVQDKRTRRQVLVHASDLIRDDSPSEG